MDLIDSTKRRLDSMLPKTHRVLLLGLIGALIVINHDNNYADLPLMVRNTAPAAAQLEESTPGAIIPTSPAPVMPEMVSSEAPAQIETQSTPAPTTADHEDILANTVSAEATPDYSTDVKAGDNLSLIFSRAGLNAQDVYKVSNSTPKTKVLGNLYPGYRLEFYFNEDESLQSLTVVKNKLESVIFSRNDAGQYIAKENTLSPEVRQVFREATINDSLFLAARNGGISAGVTMELAGIFGGVIDFLLDTRKGDTFNVLYEEKFLNGEYIGYGKILAAQFTNQGETHTAVRYVNTDGDSDFYNPEGESMRKAFLRNPVDFTRISDGFNLRRKHPILNTIRAHKGTDYAAPRGTPVVAAGDGRVTWASRKGSFGKLVVIQHGDRFQTKYAHLNDYAKGIKKGNRVKQGQVIGYVGSTGGATGPHLHYEFLMDGVHRNSRTIHDKLPKAESVPSNEMQRFKEQSQILITQLQVHQNDTTKIAQRSP